MNFTEAKIWVKAQPKKYIYIGAAVVVLIIGLVIGGIF